MLMIGNAWQTDRSSSDMCLDARLDWT